MKMYKNIWYLNSEFGTGQVYFKQEILFTKFPPENNTRGQCELGKKCTPNDLDEKCTMYPIERTKKKSLETK